jgi:hypothetical protein
MNSVFFRFFAAILLGALLFVNFLPTRAIAASPYDAVIERIFGKLKDSLIDQQLDQSLKDLEPSILKELDGTNDGAAIFIPFYKGPSGERGLSGVQWATGACFSSAFSKIRKTPSVTVGSPPNMVPDNENSYVIWVKGLGGKLFVEDEVKWPWWEAIARKGDADCPEKIIAYGLTVKGADIDVLAYPNGERASYHEVGLQLFAGDKLIDQWIVWARWCGGHTHYKSTYFKVLTDVPYMINGEVMLGLKDTVEKELGFETVDPNDPNKDPCN